MTSPITVPITAILITAKERTRNVIRFQNTGANPVYLTKQLPDGTTPDPSATIYDYLIPALLATDPDASSLEVKTTAAFKGIAVGGVSTLAIAKTFTV